MYMKKKLRGILSLQNKENFEFFFLSCNVGLVHAFYLKLILRGKRGGKNTAKNERRFELNFTG